MLHPSLVSLFLPLLSGGEAPQWAGFRGNNGTGLAAGAGLPDALDPESNLIWRVDVPAGYSSPVVAGKDLVLTGVTASPPRLVTLCLDAYSGDARWKKELEYDGSRPGASSPAASSPVTDGEVVVALFHHMGLVAYDMSGKELWKQAIGPFNIPHGMASSPLIHGDLVVVQVDQDESAYVVAYDRKTGAQRWKTERPGVTHSYATPAIHAPAGRPAQLVVSGSFQIASYALASGEKLWWFDGAAWQSKCAPVIVGQRCFVNSSSASLGDMGYPTFSGSFADVLAEHDADGDGKIAKTEYGNAQLHQVWFIFDLDGDELLDGEDWTFALASNDAKGGFFAIDLDGKGDVTGSKLAWRYDERRGLSDFATPLAVDGTLYMIGDGSLLTSFDAASGKVVKQERVGQPDSYYASPVAGDGKLYLASQQGILTVVKATPEFEELSSHALEDEEVWATPALAGHAVYVRGKEALYCFERAE